MKKIPHKTLFLILGLLLLAGWFYWFQTRPALARQSCQQLAYERGNDYFNFEFLQNETALRKSQLQEEYMEKTYTRCLHEKGIE